MTTKHFFHIVFITLLFPLAASAQDPIYEPYLVTTFAGTPGVVGSDDGTGMEALFASPSEIAISPVGTLYVADTGNHLIRKITPAGVVTTLAGTPGVPGSADGTGSAAQFNSPIGIAINGSGPLYVADSDNHTIRKVTTAGVVTTLAGSPGVAGSADGVGAAARFTGPRGMAVDSTGNVYVADTFNNTIRKITPAGVVTTLAGTAGAAGSADGTGSAARFNRPRGVGIDSDNNLYVADTANNTIRKVTLAGVVTTFAGLAGVSGAVDGTGSEARFFGPIGIDVGADGNVFVADTVNDTIRKITPAGVVTTLAGLPLTAGSADGAGQYARFASPQGVGVTAGGVLYISDTGNNTIRISGSRSVPLNISTRGLVQTGENVLIGGFIVVGNEPKTTVLRAIGPSLANFGISGVLEDPVLELRAGDGSVILTNDNWQDEAAQKDLIEASGLAPSDAAESAMVVTLDPGNYTAIVSGKNATSGVGLFEAYDIDQAADSHFGNISTRGSVLPGENVLIGGFIVGGGDMGGELLIRAIGPTLGSQGVADPLADPTLELHNVDGDLIESNDNWKDTQEVEIESTGLSPSDDAEAAILAIVPPGAYTAIVAGKNGSTGVALVEVYALE
ncbi:MAG: NHL repeat-containing protein [Verrucomicrobiota bacterium]|nr:NHL repeat-containing protein [Verrucomicrobiota bacterium]